MCVFLYLQAFQIFDFDRDGVIDKDDLRKSLIAMGQEIEDIHEEELDKMMSEVNQHSFINA